MQAVAGRTDWRSWTLMAQTTPVSSGWISLVLPLGMILPVAVATMSTLPKVAHAIATQKIRFVYRSRSASCLYLASGERR
ncbi:hypothetical protein ACVILJ_002600 [Bradyrhizobium diazoefficiens]|nr:hypothetical protein BD122_14025 [Bradyrhizobium diazoefficiens]